MKNTSPTHENIVNLLCIDSSNPLMGLEVKCHGVSFHTIRIVQRDKCGFQHTCRCGTERQVVWGLQRGSSEREDHQQEKDSVSIVWPLSRYCQVPFFRCIHYWKQRLLITLHLVSYWGLKSPPTVLKTLSCETWVKVIFITLSDLDPQQVACRVIGYFQSCFPPSRTVSRSVFPSRITEKSVVDCTGEKIESWVFGFFQWTSTNCSEHVRQWFLLENRQILKFRKNNINLSRVSWIYLCFFHI
jgi:hypothetical protein